MEDFAQFLEKHLADSRLAEEQQLDSVFVPDNEAVSETDIKRAEEKLGINLPRSYQQFLLLCGPGLWCGDHIPHPSELYAFDESCWEMTGFIPLIHNVLGFGDYVAVNPADFEKDGERPLYYCSHDPFGYARVADSFEDWCRKTVEVEIEGMDTTIYDRVEEDVCSKWKEYLASQPKKWWQFWR
jgi:hypothetical protein